MCFFSFFLVVVELLDLARLWFLDVIHRHHHHEKGLFILSFHPFPLQLRLLPKDPFRCYVFHNALPFPSSIVLHLRVTPPLLGLSSVGGRFYLLSDRNGRVCQQGRVEVMECCVVVPVDDSYGGHVCSAQAGR